MSTTIPSLAPASPIARPSRENVLWAVIGALAVALLGLAALLVWGRPAPGTAPLHLAPATESVAAPAPRPAFAEDGPMVRAPVVTAPPGAAPMAGATRQPLALAGAQRAHEPAAGLQPGAPADRSAMAVCGTCGVVESVTPVRQSAPPTGVGAVAGGVLGGVLGNQVGGGSGRALATVAGAVGGGYVGHQVERNVRTTTRYRIGVRMDDGRLRTVSRAQPVAVGSRVTVNGGRLRTTGGDAAYGP